MGPEMESSWNKYIEKGSPELILDAIKASAKKMFPKSHDEVSEMARDGGPRDAAGLGALNKGKT